MTVLLLTLSFCWNVRCELVFLVVLISSWAACANLSIKSCADIPLRSGEKLPTKLPTITNTFRRSAQLAIGNQPSKNNKDPTGSTINAQPSTSTLATKYQPRERKDGEGNRTSGPNENIKYKLSRENKTIWDLYAEWYIGLNGKLPIKKLIEEYGWRRWKVSEDSHFFPTRRIIIDYIEMEVDRGIRLGRFKNPDQPREDIRKILVSDLEKFRINNVLTLNSLSLFFRYMTKKGREICIFEDFKNWNVRLMSEEEKTKSCKRSHLPAALASGDNSAIGSQGFKGIKNLPIESIPANKSKSMDDVNNPAEQHTSVDIVGKTDLSNGSSTLIGVRDSIAKDKTPTSPVETEGKTPTSLIENEDILEDGQNKSTRIDTNEEEPLKPSNAEVRTELETGSKNATTSNDD